MTSFSREYQLDFQPTEGKALQFTQSFDKQGLMVDFNITKSITKAANIATISITNPSKDTIATLQKEGIVRFKAGYKGDIATILVGNKQTTTFIDEGGTKRVELTILEGITKYTSLQFSKQYGKGTTNIQIIKDLVAHIVESNPAVESSNFFFITDFIVYSSEQVVFGNALELLDKFLLAIQYQYFINKGILTIIERNGFIKDLEVILNPDNGLIGYPRPISENNTEKVAKPGVQCRSILNYNFDVGRRLRLFSKDYQGQVFIIDTVNFVGNSFEGEWVCDIKALDGSF
jgi:hypothetical protein